MRNASCKFRVRLPPEGAVSEQFIAKLTEGVMSWELFSFPRNEL